MVTIMQTPTAVQNENNTLVAKKNTQCFGNRTIEYCIKHSSSGPRLCGTKKLILDIEAVAQAWLVQIQSVIFYLVQSLSLLSFLLYSPFHLLYYLFSLSSLSHLSSLFYLLSSQFLHYILSLLPYLLPFISSLVYLLLLLDFAIVLLMLLPFCVSLLLEGYHFCANTCLH